MSIFKRDSDDMPLEIIGNMINIQREKETTEKLQQREKDLQKSEQLYKQAQLLSRIGHYSLDLNTKQIYLTDELKRICDLDLDRDVFDYSEVTAMRHPEDAEMVAGIMKRAFELYEPFDFYFRLISKKGIGKTVHAIGEIMFDEEGRAAKLVGTFQDVTERYQILDQLKTSDARHKQAEALTHIGSYLWNIETGELEWSDEMFRIYGLEPTENSIIDSGVIKKFNHPDDNEIVTKAITESVTEKQSHDFYYRIILENGNTKILHARGNVLIEKDKATRCVGTAQDVTEKQMLIRQLRQSENMYKQAEELADMGNWRWDIINDKLEWTDQLYKIYGLDPQTEKITVDRFLQLVHPSDRAALKQIVDQDFPEEFIDNTFRIITDDGTEKTIRSVAQVQKNKEGQVVNIIGTEQDITERQNLFLKLQESEKLFKQAQALARLGNWTMDLKTNQLNGSEEIFKIYEIENNEEISMEIWAGYLHPEDREPILKYVNECIQNKTPYDKHHRIITASG